MESPEQHPPHCAEILVVEDSPTQAELLRNTLEQHRYRVYLAQNGPEALDFLRGNLPTLVITDINMPGMDGYELCRRIRADERLKSIPVILLTALADPKDVLKGLESGADNFLTKPYNPKQLLSRIQNICSSLELRRSDRMQMGVEVFFGGRRHFITSERQQILDLLLATYEAAVQVNFELQAAQHELRLANQGLERKVAQKTAALQQELTERKRTEERIREQAELLDKARDSIFVSDVKGRISYWNKSAEVLYGWSAEEALDMNAFELFAAAEDTPNLSNVIQELLHDRAWAGELRQRTKRGHDLLVEGRLTLMQDSGGRPKSILYIITDVTEKKRMEAQFLRAQRLESIGTLASGIAHDLNNALAPILMVAGMLKDEVSSPSGLGMLETVQASAERGAEMVKQILAFGRGIQGTRQTFPLKPLVQDVVKLAKMTFPRNIKVVANAAADLSPVIGDVTGLHQVLVNLCVNARDAMPKGGELQIDARNIWLQQKQTPMQPEPVSGGFVALSVRDTGTGIPEDLQNKIFEPFFTTKEAGKGTGLGLPTVLHIVRQHGGLVEVASESHKGSSFTVYIPAQQEAAEPAEQNKKPELLAGKGEQILLADDEAALLQIGRSILETFNYRVMQAANGAEALMLFTENKDAIQLVITDVVMPIMDGARLIEELRLLDPKVKVICTTGLGSQSQLSAVEVLKPNALLDKPYTSEKLLRTVHDVLKEGS